MDVKKFSVNKIKVNVKQEINLNIQDKEMILLIIKSAYNSKILYCLEEKIY